MTLQWERLAGNTGRFAIRMAFAADPDDGEGIDGATGLSWGCFQLWVEGRNLCAHMEQGERVDSVHWYLLPLLEWFAENWNPLLHEERLPVKNRGSTAWRSLEDTKVPPPALWVDEERAFEWSRVWQDWWQRHCLRSCREGGLFPEVVFRRHRDTVEVSWGPVRNAGTPHHFHFMECSTGVARLQPREVAEPLHDMLTAACEHLLSLDGKSVRFRALKDALHRLTRKDQRQRRLGWLAALGQDEKSVRKGWHKAKRWLADGLDDQADLLADSERSPLVIDGSCQAALMFGCVDPDIRREDALSLADAIARQYTSAPLPESLISMRRSTPVDEINGPPWLQGYELAEDFHKQFDGEFVTDRPVDIEQILAILNVEVVELSLSAKDIRGVAIASTRHRPSIAWNATHIFNARPWGQRFTLAHELCHLLFDWEIGRGLAIASGPWAPFGIEQRANSFAAMLLMPTEAVSRIVSDLDETLETPSGVDAVARRLGTGYQSTLWHLDHLGFIDETTKERLLNVPLANTSHDR